MEIQRPIISDFVPFEATLPRMEAIRLTRDGALRKLQEELESKTSRRKLSVGQGLLPFFGEPTKPGGKCGLAGRNR
jgi:hypothetical protein